MMSDEEERKLLNAQQVAKQLGTSVTWVLHHAAGMYKPQIPSIKMGKNVRFRQADIDAFIEHCKRAMANGLPIQ
jgi:predicted DNA-binding transcriptional regulator AlpA